MSLLSKEKKIAKEMWWLMVLTSIVSIIFGLVALFWPGLTLATLIFTYAIFVIVAGAVALFESVMNIKKDPLWWLALLFALFNIIVGVYLVRNPLVAGAVFVLFLALYVFVQSIIDLVVASYATKEEGRWLWVVTGILGLVAGFTIFMFPVTSSIAFVWVLGAYTLVHGVVGFGYAMQIRGEVKKLKK